MIRLKFQSSENINWSKKITVISIQETVNFRGANEERLKRGMLILHVSCDPQKSSQQDF